MPFIFRNQKIALISRLLKIKSHGFHIALISYFKMMLFKQETFLHDISLGTTHENCMKINNFSKFNSRLPTCMSKPRLAFPGVDVVNFSRPIHTAPQWSSDFVANFRMSLSVWMNNCSSVTFCLTFSKSVQSLSLLSQRNFGDGVWYIVSFQLLFPILCLAFLFLFSVKD